MAQVVVAPEVKSNRLKIVAGEIALDGTNPTPVNLAPFFKTKIVAAALTIKGTTALADATVIVWYNINGLVLDIYGGTHDGSDPTITDSGGNEVISYVAVGY